MEELNKLPVSKLADMVYDFENRTCENCNNWSQEHIYIGICKSGIDQCSVKDISEFTTMPTFSCNRWVQK